MLVDPCEFPLLMIFELATFPPPAAAGEDDCNQLCPAFLKETKQTVKFSLPDYVDLERERSHVSFFFTSKVDF